MASEYLKWKYRDVQPEEAAQYTKAQKARNWWHYHKWWLLVGALLLLMLVDIGRDVLGIGRIEPDYQLAYVASAPLSEETCEAVELALAGLGEDCNGDGRVTFQLNAYVDMSASKEGDALQYAAASRVKLMADLEGCDSYFFLCDDYETLQSNFEILADSRGAIAQRPGSVDSYLWENCPALAELGLPREELSGLYLARRGFWEGRTCKYQAQCDALWSELTKGASA